MPEYLQSDIEEEESLPFSDEVKPRCGMSPASASHEYFTSKDSPEAKCFLPLEKTLKPEALDGFRPLVNKDQDTGIVFTCESPCFTPVLPVKKLDGSY